VGSEQARLVVERVTAAARPLAEADGLELVAVEYLREAGGWVIRVYLDKPGGISLDDCQRVSRQLGDLLDVEDPTDHAYTLEVSSPGLDRPLVSAADFARFAGRLVRIQTEVPLGGQRRFRGRLLGIAGDTVQIEVEGARRVDIPHAAIQRARLVVEWEGLRPRGLQASNAQ
jgi:ribosome maturation factor RimP